MWTLEGIAKSQCTFWCSVLSDSTIDTTTTGSSKVSMHLLVLSAFRHDGMFLHRTKVRSQCTFWCSVLSDLLRRRLMIGLRRRVSMHLLVLSAFRPEVDA